ncbi:unnamed protein product (macronuclear) [Paramecium tetraurelia]|uniref:PHD-type domain-containing protein n=1 Tax=Paramecium tetraurelia TaxID=5888 RepID=A0EIB9_PARTE|nr:uncharacterized protein GSPATT00027389001 [Paramecium tetraurelia]CAK95060.1 unnamed protein product [Paramecium tetraurelia]|eukprot:XP_001462433.1 hypothetical protein (macronuclear) [Paramecium tetraurelia strain d4-2]
MKFNKLNNQNIPQIDRSNTEKLKQNSQACVYCKGPTGTIKCNKCNAYAHVYCILLKITDSGGFRLDYSESSKENQWQIYFNYKQMLSIDNMVQSNRDKQSLKNNVQNIFEQYMKIQGNSKQIKLDVLFQQYFQTDKIEEEKESILSWICFKHKSAKSYCYCKQEVDSDDMVQCETCTEWFHDQCVRKYQKDFQEQKSKEIYCCPFCIRWAKNKLNHILRFNPISNLNQLFPPVLKLNFISLLIIGIYCERALDRMISKYNEAEYQILQFILSNLPFPNSLQTQLGLIEEKSKLTDLMNFIFTQKIPYRDENQWIIRSQLDDKNNTIPENIQHNSALKNKLLQVITLFKDLEECQFYQELLQKLNHLQKAFDIIIMKQKITKTTILMEYKSTEFQEFIYLQQQIPTYKRIKREFVSTLQKSQDKFQDFETKFNGIIDSSEEEEDEDDELEEYQKLQKYFELEIEPIHNYQEFFNLISQSRIKLNQCKINVEYVNKILKQIENLSIKVSWISYIEQEVNQGLHIIGQLEDSKLYNQNNAIQILINKMEQTFCYYKDFPKHYAFLSKIKLYELYIQDLDYYQDRDDDDDDSELQQITKEIQIKISIPHLQMLKDLQKETKAPQKEVQLLSRVEKQMNEYRQKLRNITLQKGLNEQLRKKYQAELQMNKLYDVPEIKELQQKLEIFQEVEKIRLAKTQTFQQLEMCLEKSKQYNFDDKIIHQFECEINKYHQKKKEIQRLLENEIYECEQLDQAKLYLYEISQSKIIFEEKQQLQSLNKACQFIQQLYEFYQKYKSPEQEMEIEDDKNPDLQFKINQISNPFSIIFKNDQESMINDLEAILNKQQNILDKRINNVFNQYSNFLWQKQTKILLSLHEQKSEISNQLIESVITKKFQLQDHVEQTKLDQFIELFNKQFVILNQIVVPLQDYINKQPKEISLSDWFEGYNKITLNIKGGIWDQVKIYNVWVTIITKFQEIENSELHTYESLKLLLEIIQMSHMPKYSAIIQIINQKVNNFNNLVDKFKEYGQRKQVFLEKKKSKQESSSKQKLHFQILDAIDLEQKLKRISNMVHDFFSKEFCTDLENIKQIQEDFNNCNNDDIQIYSQLYQRLTQSFIQDDLLLDQLKIKIYQSKIRDIVKGKKTVELQKAKKQYTSLMNLMEGTNNEFEEYVSQFNNILAIAENVQTIANKIKNEQDYKFEELELCIEDIGKILNIEINDKEDVLIKYQECQQVKKDINEIQSSSVKCKEIVVQNLVEKLEQLPLQDEKQLAQTWLNQYEQLKGNYSTIKQMLQKQKSSQNCKQLTELMKKLQKQNEDCIIIHPETENLLRDYQEFNKRLEQIECNPLSDQSQKEFKELKTNLRWGEQYERVRMAIWIKQVNQFKSGQSGKQGFSSFQNLVHQGYEILESALLNNQKLQVEKLKGFITYLEQLMNKIINVVTSSTNGNQLIEGKIDISQLVLELQHASSYQKQEKLKDLQPRKPFDDLNQYLDKIQMKQKKRMIPSTAKDKPEQSIKKVKKSSYDNYYEKLRIEKRHELLTAMKQVPILKDRKDLSEKAKEIENQQFGEYVQNKSKYEEVMQLIIETYRELQKFPNYSKQLFSAQINLETTAKAMQKYQDGKLQKCEDKYKQVRQQDVSSLSQIKNNNTLQTQKIRLKSQTQSTVQKQQPQIMQNVKLDKLNQQLNNQCLLIQKLQESKQQQQQQKQQILQVSSNQKQQPKLKEQNQIQSSISSSQDSVSQGSSEFKLVPNNKATQKEEEKDPKIFQNKKEVYPYIYGDKLTKIGQNGSKLVLPDGSTFTIDYFSHQTELRYNKFPKLIQDLKISNYQDQEYILKEIEKISQQNRQQVLSGQIVPERLQDLEALNRVSEELQKDHRILEYKLVDTIVYLMHHEQMLRSDLFCNFRLEEIILRQHLIKQEEIYKQLDNYISTLCFVISLKQQQQGIWVSNFSGISIEIIKNLSQSYEFRKWKESRKNQEKMQQKQIQENSKLQFEPATSEEEFNDNNNQVAILSIHLAKSQRFKILRIKSQSNWFSLQQRKFQLQMKLCIEYQDYNKFVFLINVYWLFFGNASRLLQQLQQLVFDLVVDWPILLIILASLLELIWCIIAQCGGLSERVDEPQYLVKQFVLMCEAQEIVRQYEVFNQMRIGKAQLCK